MSWYHKRQGVIQQAKKSREGTIKEEKQAEAIGGTDCTQASTGMDRRSCEIVTDWAHLLPRLGGDPF